MNRTANQGEPRRDSRRAEFQPGYQAVLVRQDIKQRIRDWRSTRNLHDTHIERCLTSALIEIGLAKENEERLFELLSQAVAKDFSLSAGKRGAANESRQEEAGSLG